MSELDELHKTKSSTLATQRYRLHIFQACLQSAAQRANTAVQYPDNAELLEARSDVVSTLEALRSQPLVLEPQANSKLEFFIETEEFLYVVNEIGEVSETSPCPDTTTAEGSGLKLFDRDRRRPSPLLRTTPKESCVAWVVTCLWWSL